MKTGRVLGLLLLASTLFAALAIAKDKEGSTPGRLLSGRVIDKDDNPLVNAIVYVTDTRSRAVKTYIVGPDGSYRFPALSASVGSAHKGGVVCVSNFASRSVRRPDLERP